MDLIEILQLEEKKLHDEIFKHLSKNGYLNKIFRTEKYIFGKGEIPILLVAHTDIVHKKEPVDIFYDKEKDVLWSPTGIGGDDRCGVYAICKIIEKYNPYVLFTTDEEIGGKGASRFVSEYNFDLWNEVKYAIEIDRKGKNEAVFYDCDNKEFKEYVKKFEFEERYGSFTDICMISPTFDIASVNLSAGYYNAHTTQEFIKVKELKETINKVEKMLKHDKNQENFFDYQQKKYEYRLPLEQKDEEKKAEKEAKSIKDLQEEEYWEAVDDWYALSDEKFKEKWKFKKPTESELYGQRLLF